MQTQPRIEIMIIRRMLITICCCYSAATFAQDTTAAVVMQKMLNDFPDREVLMLTVEYQPGAASPLHRHNAHTFVYVLEGSIVMQVKGGEPETLSVGMTFYETPEDIHTVSKNASAAEPAKFLVFFIKQQGAAATVPVD
jgi:quercetin dioxygenase-like cupin family protein